jgi:competence protein ComEA
MNVKTSPSMRLIAAFVAIFFAMNFLALAQTPAPKAKAAVTEASGVKVNVNQANAEQLMTIRGIGPVLAKRIIEFRDKNGPFKKHEDLLAVQGIGEKNLVRLKEQIVL